MTRPPLCFECTKCKTKRLFNIEGNPEPFQIFKCEDCARYHIVIDVSPANPDNPNSGGACVYLVYPKWIVDRFIESKTVEFNEGTGFGTVVDYMLREKLSMRKYK